MDLKLNKNEVIDVICFLEQIKGLKFNLLQSKLRKFDATLTKITSSNSKLLNNYRSFYLIKGLSFDTFSEFLKILSTCGIKVVCYKQNNILIPIKYVNNNKVVFFEKKKIGLLLRNNIFKINLVLLKSFFLTLLVLNVISNIDRNKLIIEN